MSVKHPIKPATARACANIALVKYWGKRDSQLNLPAAGSLSLTLAALTTETTVSFGHDDEDRLWLQDPSGDVVVTGAPLQRLSRWLDLVRRRAKITSRAHVRSHNNFPTASGLASSASAYAALATAATVASGINLSRRELSILARRGSGSAARSIFAGLVKMHRGDQFDGNDCFAEPIDCNLTNWPLRMIVCIVDGGIAKKHSSRDAMEHCKQTSPLYPAWVDSVGSDLAAAEAAIDNRNLNRLGEICEASALTMHASALAARPAISYFAPTTIALMKRVRDLREDGVDAYFTMDAGPHVKVLTLANNADTVATTLRQVSAVSQVIISSPGPAALLVKDHNTAG